MVPQKNMDALCTAYADAYAGTEMTAQEIWEEVVCDSLGDMNIFADSEISDAAAFLLAHIKVESETVAQESTRAPPSKINGRASIDYHKKLVQTYLQYLSFQTLVEKQALKQIEKTYPYILLVSFYRLLQMYSPFLVP